MEQRVVKYEDLPPTIDGQVTPLMRNFMFKRQSLTDAQIREVKQHVENGVTVDGLMQLIPAHRPVLENFHAHFTALKNGLPSPVLPQPETAAALKSKIAHLQKQLNAIEPPETVTDGEENNPGGNGLDAGTPQVRVPKTK